MDLESQARIKEIAEQYGPDQVVVILGAQDVGGAEIAAQTVTTGDPTFAGPLAGVELRLPVFHILEPEMKSLVDPSVFESEVSMMEMVMEDELGEILEVTRRIREEGSVPV